MSAKYRASRNEHDEPVVTITLVGGHDIHRFAYNLLSQQVEFAEMGRNILKGQRRRMGKKAWDRMWRVFHGDSKPPMTFSWKRDV
jgi:hypothetical protein